MTACGNEVNVNLKRRQQIKGDVSPADVNVTPEMDHSNVDVNIYKTTYL